MYCRRRQAQGVHWFEGTVCLLEVRNHQEDCLQLHIVHVDKKELLEHITAGSSIHSVVQDVSIQGAWYVRTVSMYSSWQMNVIPFTTNSILCHHMQFKCS